MSHAKELITEVERNSRILAELKEATGFRIEYKTKDGWKRLRVPTPAKNYIRSGAMAIVCNRLASFIPQAVQAAQDETFAAIGKKFLEVLSTLERCNYGTSFPV